MKKITDYQVFHFECALEHQEILIAFLTAFPFESFVQESWGLQGYITSEHGDAIDVNTDFTMIPVDFKVVKKNVPNENWNAKWESEFTPVEVDNYCRIRADFHESKSDFKHEIIINPKMAFGTGHHETTMMMISTMKGLDFRNKSVFDFGAGTGVLAILAQKEGATSIDAIDYDENSFINMKENFEINNTPQIKALWGELTSLESQKYDIILANINRKVLLDSAESLSQMLIGDTERSEGTKSSLLLSGILKADLALVSSAYERAGFGLVASQQKGEWMCLHMQLTTTV